MSLTINQLFTPAESGVGLNPNIPAPSGTWLAQLLDTATAIGLDTTSWQAGGPERTILAIAAVALAQEDVIISVMAQGGFLDYAASGTVTTVALDGTTVTQPVTPDPSIPSQNPTGALGWLDALGSSFYDEDRLLATYATGNVAIANTTAGTLNYVAGNYHLANTSTGATYANADTLTLPPSLIAGTGGVVVGVATGTPTTTVQTQTAHGLSAGDVVYISGVNGVTGLTSKFATVTFVPSVDTFQIAVATSGTWTSGGAVYLCTVASFVADVIGIGSNAAPGAITTTVTQNVGVVVINLAAISAANYESNASYARRLRLKLASLSPNGPAAAYEYFALSAAPILLAETPSVSLTNGPIDVATTFSNPQTGVVTTLVSSTTPASTTLAGAVTPGCAQLAVTGATNTSPIVITTASAHGLANDDAVTVSGVLGNFAANGTYTITYVSPTTFSLNTSTGTGTYTGGGQIEGGDLGQIDRLLQAKVVPDGIVAFTKSALAFPVAVVATVVVPAAFVTTYQAAAPIALQNLIASYPIGGVIPPGGSNGTIPISAIEGALFEAGVLTVGQASYVRQITGLTINGMIVDLNYPTPEYVAILPIPTITVVGV